jgi:hypothetical protein
MSLLSALFFLVVVLELFYSKRPFGNSWNTKQLSERSLLFFKERSFYF